MSGGLVLPVVISLAMLAGAGWGSALTFARLRPERLALVQQAEQRRIMREMQATHDAAIQRITNDQLRSLMDEHQRVASGRQPANHGVNGQQWRSERPMPGVHR